MKKGISFLIAIITFSFCLAQTSKKQTRQLDQLIEKQIEKNAPGLAVGIVLNGEVVYSKYEGLADIPSKIPISKYSRFNYASSGKQFTAISILKLINEGKIDLKEDIRKYFPSFYPEIKDSILIEHLLNHSSGIRDVYELWSLQGITWWEITLSNKDAMNLIAKQQELNFEPGSQHIYSNSNYILLTEIVKKVTGNEFVTYSKSLFNQLGMKSTSFEADHQNISDRVLPYGFWKRYREYDWNTDLHGDGALFTTLEDQLQWEKIIQKKQHKTLPKKVIERSQLPIIGSSILNYGYGLEFDTENTYSFHYGSTGAYGATFIRDETNNLSVVVMTNYSNISSANIAQSCLDIMTEKEVTTSSFPTGLENIGPFVSREELVGTYSTKGGYFYKFVEKEGKLFLDRAEREDVEIEHEQGNIYHEINDPDFKQVFELDTANNLQVTAYYPTHDPYSLTRIATNLEGYDYEEINGTYTNSELDLTYEVKYMGGDAFKITSDENEWQGQLFSKDVLWTNFKIIVNRDASNSITDLMVNKQRIQNVRFSKVDH